MYAFYNSPRGKIKIYCDGADWKLTCKLMCDSQKLLERWCSVWSADKLGSLYNAIEKVDGDFIPALLVICNNDKF